MEIVVKLGCSPVSLRVWMRQVQRDGGERPGQTSVEKARIKELERELHRKDRALAETAALLVLSKKVEAIFRRGEDE